VGAEFFVAWLSPQLQARWLDVGRGTGALMAAILSGPAPSVVYGVDSQLSAPYGSQNVYSDLE